MSTAAPSHPAAIVTGAARGIGAAVARLLAARGHPVAVLDVLEVELAVVAEEIAKGGGQSMALRCDVGQRADVERAVAQVEARFGVPLLLVNNAGVGGPFHRVDEVSDDEWDWIIHTNLRSVFLFARLLLPKMKAAAFGRIVNVASIQGLLGSSLSSTYVASKHGIVGYTRTLAAEWGPHGITCNAVCPGYVETALGIHAAGGPDYLERVLAKSPVKRIAEPQEVAALIGHLLGPDGGYINGATLPIDGGISAHLGIF